MKILASRIAQELNKAKHCAVYEPDLSRVWPDDSRLRQAQIVSFAKLNGWRLASTRTDSAQSSIKTLSLIERFGFFVGTSIAAWVPCRSEPADHVARWIIGINAFVVSATILKVP